MELLFAWHFFSGLKCKTYQLYCVVYKLYGINLNGSFCLMPKMHASRIFCVFSFFEGKSKSSFKCKCLRLILVWNIHILLAGGWSNIAKVILQEKGCPFTYNNKMTLTMWLALVPFASQIHILGSLLEMHNSHWYYVYDGAYSLKYRYVFY